jgi:hypothetical protein
MHALLVIGNHLNKMILRTSDEIFTLLEPLSVTADNDKQDADWNRA